MIINLISICTLSFKASTPFTHVPRPNMAENGLLDYVISPTPGKWSYAACLLHVLSRYNVCLAYNVLLQAQEPLYTVNQGQFKEAGEEVSPI